MTPPSPGNPLAFPPHVRKRVENTPHGCRARAADDLVRAAAATGEQPRLRLEHSAAAWGARADILERLEAKFQARAAAQRGS